MAAGRATFIGEVDEYGVWFAGRLGGISILTGTPYSDHLAGDGKNNVIEGGEGSDILIGGGGLNRFVFRGGFGLANAVIGSGGGPGFNHLEGRGGDDTLVTTGGFNVLIGGSGFNTAVIAYGSSYSAPYNDISRWIFLMPPAALPVDTDDYMIEPLAPLSRSTSQFVASAAGGVLSHGGLTLIVPPGVLPADAILSVKQLDNHEISRYVPLSQRLNLLSSLYQVSSSGARVFGAGRTMQIRIVLESGSLSPGETAFLCYYDEEQGAWVQLATSLEYDEESGRWVAVAEVDRVVIFAVLKNQ